MKELDFSVPQIPIGYIHVTTLRGNGTICYLYSQETYNSKDPKDAQEANEQSVGKAVLEFLATTGGPLTVVGLTKDEMTTKFPGVIC